MQHVPEEWGGAGVEGVQVYFKASFKGSFNKRTEHGSIKGFFRAFSGV